MFCFDFSWKKSSIGGSFWRVSLSFFGGNWLYWRRWRLRRRWCFLRVFRWRRVILSKRFRGLRVIWRRRVVVSVSWMLR